MTIVEIWDSDPVDNVMGVIALKPDRVVYVGFDKRMMERRCGALHRMFEMKGMSIDVECRAVPGNLYGIADALEAIAAEDDHCAFDVLGGEGIILAAMGIVCGRREISMHSFNVKKGRGYDCISRDRIDALSPAALSVDENTALYGGTVKQTAYRGAQNEGDIADAYVMWDICRGARTDGADEHPCACWNRFCAAMAALDTLAGRDAEGTFIDTASSEAENMLRQRAGLARLDDNILDEMCHEGLLTRDGTLLRYKNDFIRRTVTKAGNVLEFIVLTAALSSKEADGSPSYTSCAGGVVIGWDDDPDPLDTVNEIDVMLMRGMTPVFISCKNGAVDDEELYKLDSVASRFGGRDAVKVLVATYMGDIRGRSDAFDRFRRRAADMGIKLIFDADAMDRVALEKSFRPVNLFSVHTPGINTVTSGGTYAGYKWKFI